EAAKHAGESAKAAEQAKKHADAAKRAADAAESAAVTAKKVFTIAREAEAEDLTTRTAAAIERARSHAAQTASATSASAADLVESRSLDTTAAELAAEADKPGADTQAIAAKGRVLALKALKIRGPWQQDAAARALSGPDDEVLEYLRTGWKQAAQDEIREQVSQLSTQSPYEVVRTGAAEALKGSDQQVSDFYTTGQYDVAATDYAVRVSRINNGGGPGVKEASKVALANGKGKVLAAFISNGQYAALNTDEQVIASKRVNDGGPEMKAAAKIALAGSADELHEFVQVGQYMADRKDKLASTHIAQMQRLNAEASGIAAKARQNSWKAAEAAAKAGDAKDEAAKAADGAKKSANLARKYAADADKAATSAENSAAQAANSAKTARTAASTADRDATDAESSAAQAEFSASYARSSAYLATSAADDARASALDAGKSTKEANALATQAWTEVKKKRESEVAEARRRAEEARKQQEQKAKKPHCVSHTGNEIAGLLPCVLSGGDVTPVIDPTLSAVVWEITGLNDLRECIKNPAFGACTAFAISVLPVGKVRLLKKLGEGVEDIAEGSRVAKRAKCFKCFLAGTKVLMADRSTKDIEEVRAGDRVLATDPVSGRTGKQTVSALIVTEHDKSFNELTIATPKGDSHLTATNEHPFWSPSQNAWTEAAHLRPGMTLRTVDGSAATIKGNRPFSANAKTYNLTVENLHTYYVLAGKSAVLVHNSNCPKGRLSDRLPPGMSKAIASAYDEYKMGRLVSHDTYSGAEHPWWSGAKEYRVDGAPETARILVKKIRDGVEAIGWTSTHYQKIQRFKAPHFPDWGWND
ncbi:polymorphic toxin-type HINT domain-containing protein, partial [Streptomyces kronopolitis]